MGLYSALQTGRTGLQANQAAIEVVGHNLANVATPGFHRQSVSLSPRDTQEMGRGLFIGRGVQVEAIIRNVDEALEQRIRNGTADQASSTARNDILRQIEAIQNELTGIDLSTRLTEFFSSWSEASGRPEDLSLRSLVIQQGRSLSSYIQGVRADLIDLRAQVDAAINQAGARVDDLLTQIESVNGEILRAERGSGGAHGLRDQRDTLLEELSEYVDISTVEQPSGVVDVYIGSMPVVLNGKSRGFEIKTQTKDGQLEISPHIKSDGSLLLPTSGQLGSLVKTRTEDVNFAVDVIDEFANTLIYEVNKVHSSGQALEGRNEFIGSYLVDDVSAALTAEDAGLRFSPTHGSFEVHVTARSSGLRESTLVSVDFDGIGSDTSLSSLVADLDAIDGIDASMTPDGRLKVQGSSGDQLISFSDDTSGVLAALGVNTFFDGFDAQTIRMESKVDAEPAKVALSLSHSPGDNANGLRMAELKDEALSTFGGLSLSQHWRRHVEDIATRIGQTSQQLEADGVVLESLSAQRQAVSGVNVDEEAINLIAFQRAYQGSARFLTVVDELLQTLIQLV